MKRINRSFCIILCILLLTTGFSYASSDSSDLYEVNVMGLMKVNEAEQILIDINSMRREKGMDPLVWDVREEKQLNQRAAEISAYYNGIRPNGDMGDERFYFYSLKNDNTSVSDVVKNTFMNKSGYANAVLSSQLKAFYGAVFETLEGDQFAVIKLYLNCEKSRTTVHTGDYYEFFEIQISDDLINNWEIVCKRGSYEEDYYNKVEENGPLTISMDEDGYFKMYLYNLIAGNKYRISQFFATSSNENTVKVSSNGEFYPLHIGKAALSLKPSEGSDLEMKRTVIVVPKKMYEILPYVNPQYKVKVQWSSIKHTDGYQIYRSTKKKSGYKLIKTITNKRKGSYVDKTVKKGKTYYYKVRGYTKVGNKKYGGEFSKAAKVKVKR